LKNLKLGFLVNNSKHVRTFTQSIHFMICVFLHAGKELLNYFLRTIIKSAMLLTQG